jgi:leucyl-tRNA synthetase/ADP-ribose pyrophosphatase YjhB (NUDIX family)
MSDTQNNPYQEIEKKWQKSWYDNNLYAAIDNDYSREKKYILVEFPYPSGSNLHVGHCFRYTVPDVYSRFLRMRGYNVLFPIGWDAFGLPTEEYARKTGINPKLVTKQNVDNFREELKKLGFGFDWAREFATSDPEYYRWTQWIFGELYKNGLAEQKEIELWWCEKLSTVLANEEIIEVNGQKVSEKGEHPVEKKKMRQWILKMPEYAEELLDGLEMTNFPHFIKEMQRNWIGKSEGVVVDWKLASNDDQNVSSETRVLDRDYSEKPEDVDHSLEFGERGLTIIKIKETGEFVIYDKALRNDFRIRFPGGHIDPGENSLQAAIREAKEEAGLSNLQYIGHLGSSHGFYNWASDTSQMIHKLDHFHYFECTLKDWNIRKEGVEKHISCFLASADYVKEHAVQQHLDMINRIEEVKDNYISTTLQTFTTRVDCIYAATFLLLAPEHPKTLEITTPEYKSQVEDYIKQTKNQSDLDRQITKEKTGVFTGSYVIHPLTGDKIPVWVADFVLAGYGTGSVLGTGHDERDYEFAQKYGIPLKETIAPEYGDTKPNEVFVEGVGIVVFNPQTQLYGYVSVRGTKRCNLVAGGMELGETPAETAVRELAEEVGLVDIKEVVSTNRPFYSHYYNHQKQINRVALTHVQLVILNSDQQLSASPEAHENFELQWGTPEEIISKFDPSNDAYQVDFVKLGVREAVLRGFDTVNNIKNYPNVVITEDGVLYDSMEFSGLRSSEARVLITKKLVDNGLGLAQTNYKFRDWVFSRQRYWGEPFPFEYLKSE